MDSNALPNKERKPLLLAIKESQVSVAPDGKVIVHTAVINNSQENDQVTIKVKGLPADWITIDNPTVYVAAGAIKQVIITIQPPPYPQSDVGEFILEAEATSKYDPWRSSSVKCQVTIVAYETEGGIGALIGTLQFSVMPNASITVPMILKNRGIKDDVFIFSVEGIPANWVTTTSPLTRVGAGESKQIDFNILVPRTSQAHAGRTPFKIVITSQNYSVEKAEVDCILTVATFSQFSGTLEPEPLEANQPGLLTVKNEGNTVDHYSLTFQSPDDQLVFEKITQAPKKEPTPSDPQPELETVYTEILHPESLRVTPGESGILEFRSRPRAREIVGDEKIYPFSTKIQSSSQTVTELNGQVSAKGLLPRWVITAGVIGVLLLCFFVLVPIWGTGKTAAATQTAAANQTQAALIGQEDTDGDGLTNNEEAQLGTDPLNPDTDGDALKDGEEVKTYGTNPLVPDTDNDILPDGAEVLQHGTNPVNPDTDADLLNDGDEVNRKTDPLNPDTDQDGLNDGTEVGLGTDPLKPDTDNDGLLDGQENQNCPHPLNPDTDADGITDGRDLDPCDPNNPSLTATAAAGIPTQAPPTDAPLPTLPPPTQPLPTAEPPTPTSPVLVPTSELLPTQDTGQPIIQPTEVGYANPQPVPSICSSVGAVSWIGLLGIVLGIRSRKQKN